MDSLFGFLGTVTAAVIALIGVLLTQGVTLLTLFLQERGRRRTVRLAYLHERRTSVYEDLWNILHKEAHSVLTSRLPNVEIPTAASQSSRLETYLKQYPQFYISDAVLPLLQEYVKQAQSPTIVLSCVDLVGELHDKLKEEINELAWRA